MLYITKRKTKHLVYNIDELFSSLSYKDIYEYLSLLHDLDAFSSILNNPKKDMSVKHIVISTRFGECMLSDISTSIKIIILAKIAIKRKQKLCFIAGELGDNYLELLYNICKDTDYISLYQRDGIIPQMNTNIVLKCR